MKKVRIIAVCLTLAAAAAVSNAAEDQMHVNGFSLPAGNAEAGRRAFVEIGCTACHRVAGDPGLPAPTADADGPELRFGGVNDRVRIAQAIVSPSHTIADGYGRGTPEDVQVSPMLDLSTRMTVRQLEDVVAYLEKATGSAR